MLLLPRHLQGLGFLLLNTRVSCVSAFLHQHQAAAPALGGLAASQKQPRPLVGMRASAISISATSGGQIVEGVQAEEVSFDLGDGMVMAAKVSASNMDQASFSHLLWRDNG